MMKELEHSPRVLFIEQEILRQTSYGGLEWMESSRWIKYEERAMTTSNRWGKPQIPCLNFESLFALRKELERGAVMLDLEASDLPSVMMKVVDHLATSSGLTLEQKEAVAKVVLLRHRHIKEGTSAFRRATRAAITPLDEDRASLRSPSIRRSSSGRKSTNFRLNSFSAGSFREPDPGDFKRKNSMTNLEIEADFEGDSEVLSTNLELLRILPEDAEAATILTGSLDFLTQPILAFVRLAQGTIMHNLIETQLPIRFLFLLLSPYDNEMDTTEIGRCFSTLLVDKTFRSVAYTTHSRGQLLLALSEFLNSSIVFPPSELRNPDLIPFHDLRDKMREIRNKVESNAIQVREKLTETLEKKEEQEAIPTEHVRDPLTRRGIPFYGLYQDIKCRYPLYWSDIKDGFNFQVLSSCIFIFFAALSPSITFGGIYGQKTDKFIGVGETLLASSLNGIIFALFAAQPLLIVGSTGPLMIFDLSLLRFCKNMDLDFLSLRVWVGIWILVIGLLVAAFEAVSIVKKFTRFTEEIFSTLVCAIFIYGAFENLFGIFGKHPLVSNAFCFKDENYSQITDGILVNGSLHNITNIDGNKVEDEQVLINQPNTSLFSMCLMIGTFLVAWKLKMFRNSKFLSHGIRRALGDFGVPISIFLMVLIAFLMRMIYTDKLGMPKGLQPSNSEIRGWIINPFGQVQPLPVWCIFAAAPASLLLFILIFLEENICHLILSKPERCLKKGSGFHLDIVLSCLINTVSGFLGAPFMGPACVRTITHMSSLTVMSSNVAPGESPKIVGCIEQRLSALAVSILIGMAVMLYSVLNLVPTAVLLGIFLYMGVSATAGIQLLERVFLFFMSAKNFPDAPYVKYVSPRKMHLFTAIQVLMLAILWIVKQSPASLAVPFVLMCLIPIRIYILPRLFTPTELIALDGCGEVNPVAQVDDELDFYETAHDLPTQIESDKILKIN